MNEPGRGELFDGEGEALAHEAPWVGEVDAHLPDSRVETFCAIAAVGADAHRLGAAGMIAGLEPYERGGEWRSVHLECPTFDRGRARADEGDFDGGGRRSIGVRPGLGGWNVAAMEFRRGGLCPKPA